jgi:hypothetical protein
MFRWLASTSPSVYVFFSGLMISVATSAAAQIAFAEHAPSNSTQVSVSGAVALAAGVLWFTLSEQVGEVARRIAEMAPALGSRAGAVAAMSKYGKIQIQANFALAVLFSAAWPWTEWAFNAATRLMCK